MIAIATRLLTVNAQEDLRGRIETDRRVYKRPARAPFNFQLPTTDGQTR